MLDVRPLGYALGARVTGVDLTRPLDDECIAEIRRLWLQHVVLCFPGQDLEAEHLIAFAGRFGELDDNRLIPQYRHPDSPVLTQLSNKPVMVDGKLRTYPYGQHWHSDRQFTIRPIGGSFLVAKELPDVGGETMFANAYTAYDTLSDAYKTLIDPLQSVHDLSLSLHFGKKDARTRADQIERNPPVVHPLVRAHEETGRKALFVGEQIRNFVGMTREESLPLIDFLNEHAVRYEFVYRHRWTLGDLLMWDNRCALHNAVPDYDPHQPRRMLRCATFAATSGTLLRELERPQTATA